MVHAPPRLNRALADKGIRLSVAFVSDMVAYARATLAAHKDGKAGRVESIARRLNSLLEPEPASPFDGERLWAAREP